jgi:hypothetical protein
VQFADVRVATISPYVAVSDAAPDATVIEAAVTDDPSGSPTPNVPALDALNVPRCVTAVTPAVENVIPDTFVRADPPELAVHVFVIRT